MTKSLKVFKSVAAGVALAGAAFLPSAVAQQTVYPGQVQQTAQAAMPTPQNNLALRVEQLERELQLITGKLEEVTFKLDQSNKRIDTLTAALSQTAAPTGLATDPVIPGSDPLYPPALPDGALPPIEGPAEATGGPRNLVTDSAPAETFSPGSTPFALPTEPQAAYDFGVNALLEGKFDVAEQAFIEFLKMFPEDERAADVQFRLAEIYLATENYASAASAFLKHVRSYPDNPKSAEAYLKLGISFARLNKPADACKVFKLMAEKFPNADANLIARRNQEEAAAGC